jgi:DNA helicase II / ATP-dependent DNA helicase PcrA
MEIDRHGLVVVQQLRGVRHAANSNRAAPRNVADVDADRLLDDLDPDQYRAVTTESTLVAVIAGAGSGKTRVLTRRVAHRILSGSAAARHTLVLTFTREAAGELRRRLPALGLQERVEAGTFHSVLLGVLRQRLIDRGRPVPTVVHDRRRLVTESGTRSGVDDLVAEIDWAAARGVTPSQYVELARAAGRRPAPGVQAVAAAYEAYRSTKAQRGVIDLDDVLLMTIDALQRDEVFAEQVAWRYRHLLVDEAQDLNPLQHRIVELLRHGSDDLFIVGDPAQAVYGFNGADPGLLIDVSDRLPGIEIVRLPANHRCTPQVLDAGLHVLGVGGVAPTAARAVRPDGNGVRVVRCDDEHHEAQTVARTLRHLDPGLVAGGRVAVLGRTHAQLAGVRRAIEAAGITVRRRLDGPGSPYRDAVASAVRQGSAARLRAWAHDVLDSPTPGTSTVGATETSEPAAPAATREVADAVLDFLREQPLGDGVALRTWINTTDPFGLRGDRGVDVLTFHAAKGREWHTVVVTGVESGQVPHRSASTIAARAEEARLLYVATTRATDQLVITWAERRGGYRRTLTPFLDGYESPAAELTPPPVELTNTLTRPDATAITLAALLEWRAHAATAAGILPEQLCSDIDLRTVAEITPRSADELAEHTQLGLLTARRLYPGVADVLTATSASTGA